MRSNYARPWLDRGSDSGVIALQEAPRCRCWCARGVHTTDARYTTAKKRRSRSSGDPWGILMGKPAVRSAGRQAHRNVQERSSLTTFNKLRLRCNRWPTRGGPRLGSRFCACVELADVFVNMLARAYTSYEICTRVLRYKRVYKMSWNIVSTFSVIYWINLKVNRRNCTWDVKLLYITNLGN